jgi:Ca2+-transporting ATPase
MNESSIYNKVKITGLTAQEVAESRAKHGENLLTPPKRTSLWKLYWEKYDDPIIRILLIAAAISLALAFVNGEYIETIGIILAVFFATTVGFYFERDASRKFNVLTALGEEQPVKVIRDGEVCQIARREVVVGDTVIIETGDEVPTDGLLEEATDLQVDESSLTGETITTKRVLNASLSNPSNILFSSEAYPKNLVLRSSMVMNGSGRYVVTTVGDQTEIGKVARESVEVTGVKTPLSLQLDRLAKLISKIGSVISIASFLLFLGHDILTQPVWHTDQYMQMATVVLRYFMMAVTLIVMAVPEGLPMAITLALALNMRRMLKSNNLVRKLMASETIGAVTTICTDKTGTLTENRMKVWEMVSNNDGMLKQAIALNTTAELDAHNHGIGNPTESALLHWLHQQGTDYRQLRAEHPVTKRQPFSTERKYMATLADGTLYVKGAPEIILCHCQMTNEVLDNVNNMLSEYQSKGMRTLAFATKQTEKMEIEGLDYLGICAINDPIRRDVPQAVADCRHAGICVKMVTGDTAKTAIEIAYQIGIIGEQDNLTSNEWNHLTGAEFAALEDDKILKHIDQLMVLSRARPSDKRRLVELLQRHGEVVAVTGDGTNDAPALNRAQVGLSLGSGTSVAKNASDITLIDDSFRSIVHAVMWGRSLYKNIQRFVFFQLVVNVAALLLVLGGSFIGTELPLTVTQILWVNLIMDTFAAMALASLPPSREVLSEHPRQQNDPIITRSIGKAIALVGTSFFLIMFTMLYHIEQAGITTHELTIFFTTFVMLQWWNLFNAKMLGSTHSAFRLIHHCQGLLLVLVSILIGQWLIVTFGSQMFRTEPLPWHTWFTIFVATSPVLIVGELYRMICRLKKK